METTYVPRLKLRYSAEVVPALQAEFGYQNPMQVPRLVKVIVNSTSKDAVQNSKILESVVDELTVITGQ